MLQIGRMAGQFAKPRSGDFETIDGVSLPSYRGDIINNAAFTAEARTPDPNRCRASRAINGMHFCHTKPGWPCIQRSLSRHLCTVIKR